MRMYEVRCYICMLRSNVWWNDIILKSFTPTWVENFRMSKQTFQYLYTSLSTLQRHDTVMRQSISLEKRVAITLWCLAIPTEYRTIGHLFRVARSSVCEIVHEVCAAIVQQLLKVYIQFPEGEELDRVVLGFKRKFSIPQCVGAIDGSLIPICCPAGNRIDFYNRKGWYSVVLQGLVDANFDFLTLMLDGQEVFMMQEFLPTLHGMTKFVMRMYCQTRPNSFMVLVYHFT